MTNNNKYRIITIISVVIICVLVVLLHLSSHDRTQEIYLSQTRELIVELKKDFLKDTVNNLISEIEVKKRSQE